MFSHLFKTSCGILVNDIPAKNIQWLFKRKLNSLEAGYRATIPKEEKIEVGGGIRINYLKVGEGPKNLLFIPGVMGTIWTDYKSQVECLDKTKYTMVFMEQPGFGRSRPPDRDFPTDMYHRDADWGAKLMQELSLGKYSTLGWSNGGVSAMILAARYPERVDRLAIWGSCSYITPQDMQHYLYLRNMDNLSRHMMESYLNFYGKEYFLKSWMSLYDTLNTIYNEQEGDLCRSLLCRIQCPTLIVHGSLDPMIAPEHPHHLKEHIRNSRLLVIQGGKHDVHIRHKDEFNKVIEDFLGPHDSSYR